MASRRTKVVKGFKGLNQNKPRKTTTRASRIRKVATYTLHVGGQKMRLRRPGGKQWTVRSYGTRFTTAARVSASVWNRVGMNEVPKTLLASYEKLKAEES